MDIDEKIQAYNERRKQRMLDKAINDYKERRQKRLDSKKCDGGPGSGNFGYAGIVGEVGGSAPSLSKKETAAIDYWKEGNNGYGYADLRAIANGAEPPSVKELRSKGLDEKAEHYYSELSEIEKEFGKAVRKCPTLDGERLFRAEPTFRIPEVESEIELPKYSSFSKSEEPDTIVERFGVSDGLLYRVTGNTNFRDISGEGKAFTGAEQEAVTDKKLKFKVVKVTEEVFGGEETFLGTVGGTKCTVVDIQPI